MTKQSFPVPTDVEKQSILKIRSEFLIEANINPDLYYRKDVEKILNTDWSVHRFLLSADGCPDSGLKCLIKAMKWRKQFAIRDLTEHYFPQEFFKMLIFGRARNGSTLLITSSKYYIPIDDWREVYKKFFVFVLEWLDVRDDGNGITVLVDCRDTGISNIDFDFILFLKPIQGEFFPFLLKLHLNCELPWIMTSISQIIMSLMTEKTRKLIKSIKKRQIIDYISDEQIPRFLGGLQIFNYHWTPSVSPSAEEFAHMSGISGKSLKKLISHLKPLLK